MTAETGAGTTVTGVFGQPTTITPDGSLVLTIPEHVLRATGVSLRRPRLTAPTR